MKFDVIDKKTGKYPDIKKITSEEAWAKKLTYCGTEGFHINEDGNVRLADVCGNYVCCPRNRFKIVLRIVGIEYTYSFMS